MSTSIDNRIVEMQFDNSQFEKGVGKSIKSLEKLKKGLKMDEAAQSLSKLQKIGDSFSLAKIADGIDNLTYRFSWMGRTVSGILDNLTFKAKALIKSMSVDQISSGWSKYADKTGYVQTIMNATGKSIDEVNKYLDKLMWFSDETSYSFVDMTQALGTLTSSGGDINKLIPMLEGMANATAFAGKSAAEFSRTMYNLNQSYSSGYMQYIDWKSVEMAGVGSEQLKQAFIDAGKALGTLTKEGKTKKGTLVSIANFGTTLNEKWADTRVMEKAFGTFSEMTEKAYELIQEGKFDTASDAYAWLATQYNGVGITAAKAAQEAKSFNEAIAATTDAVSSGWMRTFEIIFGNYDEARVMWTDLANWLWDVFASGSEARNELLQSWKDIGGRTTMLEGIYSMFEAFNNLLYAIKDAWREVFPETTADDLMKISNSIKTLGDRIKEAFSYEETETVVDQFTQAITGNNNPLGAFWGELEQGAKGDEVKKLQQKLFDMGYDIGTSGVDGIFGPKTQEALKKFQKDSKIKPTGIFDQKTFDKLGESINEAFGKFTPVIIGETTESVVSFSSALDNVRAIAQGVFSVLHIGWNVLKFIAKAAVEIASVLSPIGNVILSVFGKAANSVTEVDKAISEDGFTGALESLKNFLDPIREKIQGLADNLSNLKVYIEPVKNWFLDIWNAVKLFMGAQVESASERALDFFERIKSLKSYIEPVKNWFLDIWNAVKLFMGAQVESASERALDFFERIKSLKSYIEPVKKNMIGLWNAIRLLFGATTDDLTDGAWKETNFFFTKFRNIGKKIGTIFSPIASFFDGLKERFSSFGTAIGLLLGFIDPSTLDEEKLEKAKKIIKPIQTLFSTIHVLYTKYVEPAVNWIKGVALGAISSIGEFFNQVFSVINFEDPIGTLKNIVLIIKDFATGTLGKVFEVVAPIFEKILNWIGGKLKTLWEGASSVLKSVGGWLSDSVSNVVNGVIGLFSGIDNLVATLVPIIGGLLLFNKALNIFSDVVGIASTIVNIKAMKAETDLLEAKDTNRWLKFFGSLALIIAVAAGTIYLLGNMNRENLKRGMISLGLIMLFASIAAGIILLAGKLFGMKDLEKTKDLFIGLSSVIAAMAASIFFLGMMPEPSLKQGLKAISWISLLIIGFMGIARIINIGTRGGSVFGGLTNLAMSIGILIAIAYIIGKYGDWNTFISGCRYVAVALGIMAGFCFLLTIIGKGSANISLKGLAQLSIGISLLTLVAMYIGKHYDRSIWKGLIFVGSVMVLFTFMIASLISISQGAVKVELKGILMLGIVLTALSAIVFLIGKFMSWGDAAKGLMVVGGIILAIGFLLREAGKYSENMKVGKIIALVFMLGFLAMAFAYAIAKIKNVKWQTMIAFAGSMALALGALVAACLVAGKLGAGTMISGSLGIAGALAIIIGSLTLLVAGLGEIDKLTNGGLIEALEHGGDVMAAVGAAVGKLIGGVVSGFSSVTSDELDNLATSIDNFTASFSTLKTSVSGVAEDTEFENDATKALDIANKIKEFFDKIGLETEGISTTNVEKFNGRVDTIVKNLGEFGVGIGQIRQGIAGISSEGDIDADTEKAIHVATQIKEGFFDKIGGEGMEISVDGLIKYNASITSILTYTSTFSSNMAQLRTDIGGMSETDIKADTDTALACAKVIAEFFTKINSDEYSIEETKGAINELFTGSSKTDSLIGRIKTLGENMSILHTSIGSISETTFESDIDQMMAAYNSIADFINKVSADDFKVEMEGKIYDIKDDIRMLGEGVVDFANVTKGVDVAAVSSVANAMSSAMNSVMDVAMPDAAYKASSYLGMFVTVGMNMASGLANGIRKNADLAVLASKKVASQMLEAARETLEVNSPSKKFEKIGMYSDRGLANGVSKNSGLIVSSVEDASTSALDAARSSLSNLANILMGDMDADPVIRPVVDMSDVNRSANRINGLVGGSRAMNIDATVRQAQNVASIMNRNQMQKGTNPNGINGSEPTNPVNVSGNNFYIRSDNDVKMLANELATLTKQQQRSLGAAY